jgi:hypothetical protein
MVNMPPLILFFNPMYPCKCPISTAQASKIQRHITASPLPPILLNFAATIVTATETRIATGVINRLVTKTISVTALQKVGQTPWFPFSKPRPIIQKNSGKRESRENVSTRRNGVDESGPSETVAGIVDSAVCGSIKILSNALPSVGRTEQHIWMRVRAQKGSQL